MTEDLLSWLSKREGSELVNTWTTGFMLKASTTRELFWFSHHPAESWREYKKRNRPYTFSSREVKCWVHSRWGRGDFFLLFFSDLSARLRNEALNLHCLSWSREWSLSQLLHEWVDQGHGDLPTLLHFIEYLCTRCCYTPRLHPLCAVARILFVFVTPTQVARIRCNKIPAMNALPRRVAPYLGEEAEAGQRTDDTESLWRSSSSSSWL